MTKVCSAKDSCVHPQGPQLTISEFSKRPEAADGLRGRCKQCEAAPKNRWYLRNKEDHNRRSIEWEKNNPEAIKGYRKKTYLKHTVKNKLYREANKKRKRIYDIKYRELNNDKIIQYRKDHPYSYNKNMLANVRKRQAAKIQRFPLWASNDRINAVYVDCIEINLAAKTAGCTEKFVVDHIVPLQGKLVSGLHVENNLQIITNIENCKKSNKFTPISTRPNKEAA